MDNITNSNSKQKKENKFDTNMIDINSIMNQESFMPNTASLAPVEIEELDVSSINQMNFDMDEFVEAEAIKIDKMPEQLSLNSVEYLDYSHPDDAVSDIEDQTAMFSEEENLLTKQFLNGELTFSEFTVRMDQDIDIEVEEVQAGNIVKTVTVPVTNDRVNTQKIEKLNKTRPRRSRKNLPAALQGLMGEANLRYARGEVELATQMCMEIIRQVPNAPEPFHTLSMIYENDQPDKALQFALIAAHLSPRDSDQWVRLANSSLESENLRQALTCYSKAIQASPKNIELYETRARLQEQCGDKKAFVHAYSKLLNQLGPEDGQNILKYAKLLAKRCMHENLYDIALDGMENIFKKCPQLVTLEEVNVITELLIVSKQFNRCLDILIKYTTIWIEYNNLENLESAEGDDSQINKIAFCNIPDDLAVDLKAKCIISLIELNEIEIVDTLLPKFQTMENPEISGDLFLDVAEAFMGKKEFKRALSLLEPLVNSENFSLAAVWLRHAESWVGCHDLSKGIKSYEIVRKLSPQHLGARMELAKLYKLKGQFNKAIQVLKQDPELDILDPGVIYERTKLLLKVKRYNEYFQSGLLLLSRHCVTLRSKLELTALSRTSGVRQRMEILHRDRLSRGESLQDENMPSFSTNNEPTSKQEFIMMLQMCRVACALKKYGLLQRICFTALTSKKFSNENSHIMYLCLISCIRNNDSYDGFNVVRELVRSRKKSKTWNLLNIIIQRAEDSRHNRFMMRQLGKEDAFSYLHVLHANNCLVSGTYKYALNDYISLFKVKPSALLALLVSVTLLQMACQKFSAKKNQLVVQAIAFMKTYIKLRGDQGLQETNYNMARTLHQLGLLPSAIHFYKLVLTSSAPELIEKNANLLDLKKENVPALYPTLESKIEFKKLCNLFERMHRVKRSQKIKTLTWFIRECCVLANKIKDYNPSMNTSLFPIFRLILPNLERDRGPYGLKIKNLTNLYIRVFCLGKNSNNAEKLISYRKPLNTTIKNEDFADRLFWLMRHRLQNDENILTIQDVNKFLDDVAKYNGLNQKKDELFIHIIRKISAIELKWLTRILLKDLKLNLSQKQIFETIHPDAEEFFNVTSNLQRVCDRFLNFDSEVIDSPIEIEIFSHIKPMLLERLKIEHIKKLFLYNQKYYVQTKYDGERAQLHIKDGRYKYFSRQGYDITNNSSYGEYPYSGGFLTCNIAPLLNKSTHTVILDGELMGWHKQRKCFGSKGCAYDVKKLTEKSQYQPCFVAYDILIHNDECLINKPYSDRFNYLRSTFTDKEGVLMMCKCRTVSNVKELVEIFNIALDNNDEGIAIKRHDALYKPNVREKSGCFKIKAEYSDGLIQDLDLIILGGYYGEGRYSGMVSSFLVGVADSSTNKSGKPSNFLSIVKVGSGLSDIDLNMIQKQFKPHWKNNKPMGIFGPKSETPDLWIPPKQSLVLQLRATEIIKTQIYPLGYSVRFPRILKIRYDKPWYDTCSVREFTALIKDRSTVQKLTKRKVVSEDIHEITHSEIIKIPKNQVPSVMVYDDFLLNRSDEIIHISRLFENKKICVINGDTELSKKDIITILQKHKADVVQNPGKDTFCIFVGKSETLKAQNVIRSNKYDVVKPIWLKRSTKSKNLAKIQEFYPWELFSMCPSTKRRLEVVYDQYFDNYLKDTDDRDFIHIMKNLDKMVDDDTELPIGEMKKLDRLMFDNAVSPFSVFRGITGYFYNKNDLEKYSLKFMSGMVAKQLYMNVDYIFVDDTEPADSLHEIEKELIKLLKESKKSIPIIKSTWVSDCFRNKKLLPTTHYSIINFNNSK